MYVVKTTIRPGPDSKLRRPLTMWLHQTTIFGASIWTCADRHQAHIFPSKRTALAAAREWRDRDPYRDYEITPS